MCVYIYIYTHVYTYVHVRAATCSMQPSSFVDSLPAESVFARVSGVHKGGFSKRGFSNLFVITILLWLTPLY